MDLKEYVRESINIDYPIKSDVGEGFEFTLDGEEYSTKGSYTDKLRRVVLNIRSYVGYGGVHYYGRLDIYLHNQSKTTNSSVGGYLGGIKVPNENSSFDIELVRPLGQKEIDDDNHRWETYEAGDRVNAFYSESEVKELGIKIFQELFDKGWVLEIDGMNDTEIIEKN